jgi:hypothetical protein
VRIAEQWAHPSPVLDVQVQEVPSLPWMRTEVREQVRMMRQDEV